MTINGTLIIQFFNFFLAYFLIDRILLKKAVPIIQNMRQEQATLMKEIQEEQDHLTEKELLKEKKWYDYKKIFAQTIPKKLEISSEEVPDISFKIIMSAVEMDRCSDQLEKIVVQEVIDGV